MKHYDKPRNKNFNVEPVEGIVAVKVGRKHFKCPTRSRMTGGSRATTDHEHKQQTCKPPLPARSLRAFEKEGWLFLDPKQARVLQFTARRVLINRSRRDPSRTTMFVETDLITVQLERKLSGPEVSAQLKADNLTVVRRLGFAPNTFETRIPPNLTPDEVIKRLRNNKRYKFAESSLLREWPRRITPTDPGFPLQWQHGGDGITTAGIHSKKAWDKTRGRNQERPVRIAIIDTGMQIDHPDLKDGIVGGGYFTTNNREAESHFIPFQPGRTDFPDDDHGTFCLGMAGARFNNDLDVCGSAPESDLIAIACGTNGVVTDATLARAIAYAADPSREDPTALPNSGADVISCSLGPDENEIWEINEVLSQAITFAATTGRDGRGVPILWAVNNNYYPIKDDEVCSHPYVIGVGKSNLYDRADGSAYGDSLDFVAPGANVYSTKSDSRYGSGSGTSFAAPLAAGVAALVLARHPYWDRKDVLERLQKSCDKIGDVTYSGGRHRDYGYGRINAEKAVQ